MDEAWVRYTQWHTTKFGKPPVNRNIHIKSTNMRSTYKGFIAAISKMMGDDFIKYLNFVYKQWLDCDNALEDVFPNWVGSTNLMKRFTMDKTKANLRSDKESDTYSDHSIVGEGSDGTVSLQDLF